MAEMTTRLALPLMQAAQAQKELTHNAALHDLDGWLHPVMESRTVVVPPDMPEPGPGWIVPAGAEGEWSGHEGKIARHDGRWRFQAPPVGLLAWIRDENALLCHGGTGWQDELPVAGLSIDGRKVLSAPPEAVVEPAGGATVDVEARATLSQLILNLRTLGLIST